MEKSLTPVRLSDKGDSVIIVDQRLLPGRVEYVECRTAEEMFEAIFLLKVRGAPAIGIFAAYAMYVLSGNSGESERAAIGEYLKSARPTAVNLHWAVDRMIAAADLYAECRAVHREEVARSLAIAEGGLSLLKDGCRVMTHCNAGPLAAPDYGTGLGALILGAERGLRLKAYVCETRPLLQGARITALELSRAGVDVELICDNMAARIMQTERVDYVFTGADRIAVNGDTANKIGTFGLAVLAKHFGVPFYVFAPTSTCDINCATGADIAIEERDSGEITSLYFREPVAPQGVKCRNPSFDVTPAELISGIMTESGWFRGGRAGDSVPEPLPGDF